MIKVVRTDRPSYLTEPTKVALTAHFADTGEPVWNNKDIRQSLLKMSHEKCAFCEVNIGEESKYLEVEHFLFKKGYPHLVVEWFNLLPSCKRCNLKKGTYDALKEGMIVDPSLDYPKLHLRMINYRIYGKSNIGVHTEQELGLNDTKRLILPRMKIGDAVAQALNQARSDMSDYLKGKMTNRQKGKVVRGVTNALGEALPDSTFSATVATVIDTNPDYDWLRKTLIGLGWWTETLADLDSRMRAASLA